MKKQFKHAVAIAIAVALTAILSACNVTDRVQSTSDEPQNVTVQKQDDKQKEQVAVEADNVDEEKYLEIETPFTTLFYPEQWKDQLDVEIMEGEVGIVSFAAKENDTKYPLFEITFGEDLENKLGTIQIKNGELVDVAINFMELENSSDMLLSMQEAANELLSKLPLNRETEVAVVEDLEIETTYGNLHYPGKWKEALVVKQEKDIVEFHADIDGKTVKLFEVQFYIEEDSAITYIVNENNERVPVGIMMEELLMDNGWTEEDKNTAYSMQESVNDLLEHMEQSGKD